MTNKLLMQDSNPALAGNRMRMLFNVLPSLLGQEELSQGPQLTLIQQRRFNQLGCLKAAPPTAAGEGSTHGDAFADHA